MNKRKTVFRRVVTLALALAILLPLTGPYSVPEASAVTQDEIDDLKEDASALANQKKDLQAQLKDVRADKNAAQQQKDLIERQINVIQEEIDNMTAQIEKYGQLIQEKEVELAQAEADEAEQYDLFCRRVRYMEEEGEVSYWSVLFSSADFSDLRDNFMMVEEIMEYDNKVMDDLIAIREQIEVDKAELEQAKAAQEEARKEQEAAKKEREAQEAEVDKLIGEISSQEDQLEAMEAELQKAANALDAEIRRKEKEMAAQISGVQSESGFLWPLPGYTTLSSLFAGRIHPITGKRHNHTGIDIPAPKNTKILASKSGVVTTSTYNSSYGNYVVVSHSDGTSTLYAHMNKRGVSEGQTVKQGDVVGYVGTTGSSTGNHLHFEIRVNGTRKDPVNYFKDIPLYVRSGGTTKRLN